MCQWPLLGGRVFSGLMSRRAVMGSSRTPGPGGLFDGKKGDARASRGMCAAWGVRVALWEGSGKGQLGTMWFWWEPPPWSLLPQQGGEIWGRLSGRQREPGWALGPFWCPHLALRCPSSRVLQGLARLLPWYHGCHGSPASAKAESRERDPWEARRGPGGLSALLLRSRLRRWLQVTGRDRRGQG